MGTMGSIAKNLRFGCREHVSAAFRDAQRRIFARAADAEMLEKSAIPGDAGCGSF
jgi:hypothetical protein